MPDDARPPLDRFLDAFSKDVEANAVRPLAEYLARFPGDDVGIAREYGAVVGGSVAATESRTRSHGRGRPAPTARSAESDPGARRIGPYFVVRELGRGGQGAVYLAEDSRIERRVALKVLLSGSLASHEAVERFRREAEVAAKIDDPGICQTYEFGDDAAGQWIAMRYVEGKTLAAMIAEAKAAATTPTLSPTTGSSVGSATRADVDRTLALIEKAARTLHVAHQHGVMHRDIKPGNLMVTQNGDPVVLDFGFAGHLDADHSLLTQTGDVFGTPAYMSPEQLPGSELRLDARTDVFSLAVTLYEALTVRRPFEHPTREGLVYAIQKRDPTDPRTIRPAIPRDLAVVLGVGLEKDRNRRYQTALDFAEDLRRVRMREPILAKPASVWIKLRRWSQRQPALATASVAGVVLFIASLTLLIQTNLERNAKETALGEKTAALADRTAALNDYDRLGDVSKLEQLLREVDDLWPAEPNRVSAMKAWGDRAGLLASRLGEHRKTLARLRAMATPTAPLRADSASESRPVPYRLVNDALQFKHDTLAKLVLDLDAFVDPDPHKGALSSVKTRLAFAESVRRETLDKHEAKWAAAVASIADRGQSPKYDGLKIPPQLGLVPIGKDPQSGLWEFAHLQTTRPSVDPVPEREKNGRLAVKETTGIVFVLIPGGTFRMGAVPPDGNHGPRDANVDPGATPHEGPINTVTLAPFFISKYEMTQGQWLRLVGENPSQYGPGSNGGGRSCDLRDPVEQVTYGDCEKWLVRLGFVLPTEAQWEYAARGGTATPWWCGAERESLATAANLGDAYAKSQGAPPSWICERWSDGYAVHAPVGSLLPNGFGLHDVLGNVFEWCRDWYCGYDEPVGVGDGLRTPSTREGRVFRGGSFVTDSSNARSAFRSFNAPEIRNYALGVRPARRIDS